MRLIAEPVAIRSTFTGDLKTVAARLNAEKAEQAVVITVDHASAETLAALGESLEAAARFITDTTSKDHQLTVERMVSLLVPQAPVGPVILVEAQMLAEAKKAVLESGDWLSERDIALLAESNCSASSRLNEWKRERRIFSIHHNGSAYYPIYALNKDDGYQPLSAMAEVLKVFDGEKDDWGLAYWFISMNSYLGGERPQDLLIAVPARVVAAAEYEVAGVTHG